MAVTGSGSGVADIVVKAVYGSVVEDDGWLFVGFAAGEAEEDGYVLFRQALAGGPVWFEVDDETFGAEDAVQGVQETPNGFDVTIRTDKAATFGWARQISVRIGPATEDADPALEALRRMLGSLWA